MKVLLALGLMVYSAAVFAADPPNGFDPLFNGEDLSGWHARPHLDPTQFQTLSDQEREEKVAAWMEDARQHWTVDDGELVNDGHGPYLTTDEKFEDFELLLDYKTVPLADSGIYLKASPQVQIWDYTEVDKFRLDAHLGSGGLWNNSEGAAGKNPFVLADRRFGEWNHFRIRQVGARTSVWLNDYLVVDHATMENYWDREAPLQRTGPFQLQTHGGEIRWRNLFVRRIAADEANAILRDHESQAFEPLFDGESLDGWRGARDSYEVVDGTLRCKAGRGGLLLADREVANFIARVEFRLPPGGNNGLAIRTPASGRASTRGMCELQILDNTHPKHQNIDPRQAHGSAYGIAAARHGYLRPTGEWNFQEATVNGSRVKVELNGSVILDADLSKINEFMRDYEHPGIKRTRGYFGFAGHNDPVEFRNVWIKVLPD
jgi:hypothetical protein